MLIYNHPVSRNTNISLKSVSFTYSVYRIDNLYKFVEIQFPLQYWTRVCSSICDGNLCSQKNIFILLQKIYKEKEIQWDNKTKK